MPCSMRIVFSLYFDAIAILVHRSKAQKIEPILVRLKPNCISTLASLVSCASFQSGSRVAYPAALRFESAPTSTAIHGQVP